ncbi:TIGR00282 family metallophosphoesterase [Spiroplasma turonicum]|uniref:Putative metallophosphatase n=1 Tax=Spiroplasma turonicum TaxID=216946 RepID=A0A0K1P556_9MOLU|nr:TIGR00282 family metallophosphoesterase [Spiroplasma turonicum]AKU79446.1 putative metallophosphatase [Spiroplasma turonicum]ALX70468.1 putative metallophosphatase [Spiroplasma turonicum]
MNILFIGDVFSLPGREVIEKNIDSIIKSYDISFVIANGENISHGKGINKKHYEFLKNNKVNVITSGNHIFKQKETLEYIKTTNDLLRPANMHSDLPGLGTIKLSINNKSIRVTNLMGRVFMDLVDNPYVVFEKILENDDSDIHIVDFHAEASAEKAAFAYNYDGKISALLGTHTHVQTADEQILPLGTAFITDVGMTGPINSIIGVNPSEVINKEKTGLPTKFIPSTNDGKLCGVVLSFDDITNKVLRIKRLQVT